MVRLHSAPVQHVFVVRLRGTCLWYSFVVATKLPNEWTPRHQAALYQYIAQGQIFFFDFGLEAGELTTLALRNSTA